MRILVAEILPNEAASHSSAALFSKSDFIPSSGCSAGKTSSAVCCFVLNDSANCITHSKQIGRASCRKECRSRCDWSSDVCSSDLKERFHTIERVFGWEDKFRRLLLRFERLSQLHYAFKTLAYTMINLRHFCRE